MKTRRHKEEGLRDLMRLTYERRDSIEVGDAWRTGLMARVRAIDLAPATPRFLPSFEHLVWRLVPVTTPLVLILIVILVKLGLDARYDAFQMLITGLEDLTLARFFPV